MNIELGSFSSGARGASGIVVIIDVFRAFSAAAVALDRGAESILMVNTLEEALDCIKTGRADLSIGEREGKKPAGFDFGNSPAQLARADLTNKRLVQSTTNGTAGQHAAQDAESLFAGSLITAEATAELILRKKPATVSIVAMGRGSNVRADEDEICALYLRSRLEGRTPDVEAVQRLLSTMVPAVDERLVASSDYDLDDRLIALKINSLSFAIEVGKEAGVLAARRAKVD